MPASTPIRGNALVLEIDGVDYACDATSVLLTNEEADSDLVTFCEAGTGASLQYLFEISAISSTASGSFWRAAWDNYGEEVPFTYAPHGNALPTANQPHFEGIVKLSARPPMGGEASRSTTNRFSFDLSWEIVGEPELVVA